MYNIEFYEDSNGRSELWEFLESLRVKAATNKDARNQLPRCKHSSTVLGSYVAAHSTCLSLLLPQARKRGMRICLSLLLHIIE